MSTGQMVGIPNAAALISQTDAAVAAATASALAAAGSETAAAASETAAAASEAAAAVSEAASAAALGSTQAARDVALSVAHIAADIAAGITATAAGEYFFVPVAGSVDSFIVYENVDDTAPNVLEVCRFVSSTRISVTFPDLAGEGGKFSIIDAQGRLALGVEDDGTVEGHTLAMSYVGTALGKLTDDIDAAGVQLASRDDEGRLPWAVRDDGTVEVGSGAVTELVEVETLNGSRADRIAALVDPPELVGDIVLIATVGQSLAIGTGGEISNTQEYDSVGFVVNASAPVAYLALTNDNCSNGYEPPMFGTAAMVKKLLLDEDGLAYGDQAFKILCCANAYAGQAISYFVKGTLRYTVMMSQVQSMLTIAQAEGRTCRVGAMTWIQGEQDGALGTSEATYKAALLQLANDFDADSKAITNQTERIPLVTYQTCSYPGMAVAQINAALENPAEIFCAGPIYHLTYLDAVHVDTLGEKWLGAQLGVAVKRIIVDGEAWEPLLPVSHLRQGTVLDVRFNKRDLVLDTTLVPAQTASGFTLFDDLAAAIAISSVTVIKPDTVRIVAAASIPAGSTLKYGVIACTGKGTYTGGAGNLRDSQGDTLRAEALNISQPLHNWCCIFSRVL